MKLNSNATRSFFFGFCMRNEALYRPINAEPLTPGRPLAMPSIVVDYDISSFS